MYNKLSLLCSERTLKANRSQFKYVNYKHKVMLIGLFVLTLNRVGGELVNGKGVRKITIIL
jgi:hypothetical protein